MSIPATGVNTGGLRKRGWEYVLPHLFLIAAHQDVCRLAPPRRNSPRGQIYHFIWEVQHLWRRCMWLCRTNAGLSAQLAAM